MNKFTSGPWTIGYNAYTIEAGPMKICDIRGWGHLTGTGGLNLPAEEAKKIQEANARLIAAAPEMYEASKALLERLNHIKSNAIKYTFHKQFDDLANAIAKAEGKI